MAERVGHKRSWFWAFVVACAAIVVASCSSNATPPESTLSTTEALTYCGTPFSLSVTIRESTATQQFATKTLNPAGGVVVPLELTLSGTNGVDPGRVVQGVLSFNTPTGAATCTYSATAGASPPIRLSFVSCSNGAMVGAQIGNSQTQLSGNVSGSSFATGTLSINNLLTTVDDGTACTQDICTVVGNTTVISHTNATAGTSCDDGVVCNGVNTCNGSGTCVTGTPPQKDDGDPCTVDAPSTCTEPYGFTHTKTSGCGAPASVPPYPGGGQVPSDFASGVAFVASGQTNFTATIAPQRAAVIRGRVVDRDSQAPISGASVTLLGQSSYGSTNTRSDGFYDLLVNGGDTFTIQVALAGYPTVQRKIETRWLDFSVVPDISMVPLDIATPIAVNSSGTTDSVNWSVAVATAKTDGDGTRTARVLIPPGTTISGWTPSATNLNFRVTEYTVGTGAQAAAARAAMPGELPFTSSYTYAAELSIDQVPNPTFSNTNGNSVLFYLENFTGPDLTAIGQSPVSVPAGYYDRAAGMWKPESSGRIVRILDTNGGIATLSLNGTAPMSSQDQIDLGVTTGELQALGATYGSVTNKDVWRVRMTHFSPWDCNWDGAIDLAAVAPPKVAARADTPKSCPLKIPGSVIECEDQVLGETIPVAGTPFSLNYRSEGQSAYQPTLIIPISDDSATTIPSTFDHGEVEISVAGRHALINFAKPGNNERIKWTWDRTDAYGRLVQGTTTAHVRVSYAYRGSTTTNPVGKAQNQFTTNFGSFGSGSYTINRLARITMLDNVYDVPVGGLDAAQLGLGGWTLSPVHVYEPQSKVVWYGDGTKRIPSPLGDTIDTPFDGSGPALINHRTIVATSDGSIFVGRAGTGNGGGSSYIAKLTGSTLPAISSTSTTNTFINGAPLNTVALVPASLAYGPDGRVYAADRGRIVAFDPTALTVFAVAGSPDGFPSSGNLPRTADGQPALGAALGLVASVTFGTDGLLYFAETTSGSGTTGTLIRRIRANGTLETVAGSGVDGSVGSNCAGANPACSALTQPIAKLGYNPTSPFGLTVDGAGRLLFASNARVWRVEGDGTLRAVAGNGANATAGDGGQATSASISSVRTLHVFGGSLYIAQTDAFVRRVTPDGVITTVAGMGTGLSSYPSNVPATTSSISTLLDVTLAPDGKFYTASNDRIRRFGRPLDPIVSGTTYVVSEDGSEVYQFDSTGKHTATKSVYRGTPLYQFDYWLPGSGGGRDGKIKSITDMTAAANSISPDHNVTSIDYGSNTATITSPYGVVTTINLASGLATSVSSTVPSGWVPSNPTRTWALGTTNGMLTSFGDPKGQAHTFNFSPTGLLVKDANPLSAPYGTTLGRSESNTTDGVQVSSPEFRISNHIVDLARATGLESLRYERRTHTDSAGIVSLDDRYKDGTEKITNPQLSGQVNTSKSTVVGDPRFGFGTPYTSSVVTTAGVSGSAKTNTMSVTNSASLTNSTDPFSLVSSGTAVTSNTAYSANSGNPLGTVSTTYNRGTSQRVTTAGAGRTTTETLDATDRTIAVAYDGNIPNVATTTPATDAYAYDGAGRLTQESSTGTLPGGSTTRAVTYGFDNLTGWASSITATGLGSVTYSNWDATGRPRHIVLPPSRNVDLTYDDNGNVLTVRTPLGYVHGLTANGVDLLASYAPPFVSPSGNTGYSYDRDGLMSVLMEPVDYVNYERDGAGRVARTKYNTPTGYQTLTTSYDAAGHVASIGSNLSSPNPTLAYTYEGDMITKESYTGYFTTGTTAHDHSVDKTYDGFQRPVTQKIDASASQSFGFTYDADGLVSTVTTGAATYTLNRVTGVINRSAHSLLSGSTLGGLTETYEYDAFGALTHYKALLGSTTVYDVTYEREPSTGRVSAKIEELNGIYGSGTSRCRVDYTYDTSNFLSTANRTGGCGGANGYSSWTYDADGNNTTGGKIYPNPQDRLTYDGLWNYGYDADGNITNMSSYLMFNYDAPGNLRRWYVNAGGGASYDFTIDGRNRRIAKRTTSGQTLVKGWLYDGARIVAEVDANGALVSHFAYATKSNVPDLMWHKDVSTWNLYRIVSDQLGSPMALVNISAATIDAEKYAWNDWGASFGWYAGLAVGSPVKQPFGFAGGFFDPDVGNYRFGARDYNPWLGRWFSKDPSRFGGSLNFYLYANNDPVNFFDPMGQSPEDADEGASWWTTLRSAACVYLGIGCPSRGPTGPDRGSLGGVPPAGPPANDNQAIESAGACGAGGPPKQHGSCVLERDLLDTSTLIRYCLYFCENSDFDPRGTHVLKTFPRFSTGPSFPCEKYWYGDGRR